MSLKEETTEIFARYGLDSNDIKIYHAFLRIPQATVSEIQSFLEMDYAVVLASSEKLEAKRFISRIKGIIDRFVPLEPYFELFNKESQTFREEISNIKDRVLSDQSSKFEKLESIEANAITEVQTAVKNQVDAFFKDSDEHDAEKKKALQEKRTTFEKTGKDLEAYIQKLTFEARDRFINTTNDLKKELEKRMFETRDSYEATNKGLEQALHSHLEEDYKLTQDEVNARYAASAKVLDDHSAKFTAENATLNSTLQEISTQQNASSKTMEKTLHTTHDTLNGKLKEISNAYMSDFDKGITEANGTVQQIIADLLKDFAERLKNLELECQKELDGHVDNHKENAQKLKPKLEEILDKYIKRMNEVTENLKKTISKLLLDHNTHINTTSENLKTKLNETVAKRQDELTKQVGSFKDNTIFLIDNLKDISDNMSELGEILKNRGSAWKALFLGHHKHYQELYEDIDSRVSKLSGSMKSDFENSTANYIQDTHSTTSKLQQEITSITNNENASLKQQTEKLDQAQKEQISAELRGIASDMSSEIDGTMKYNIDHCRETTVKLKDMIGKSLATHKDDYDRAIKKHLQTSLDHYNGLNKFVKTRTTEWYSLMDSEFVKSKNFISGEIDSQCKRINEHLKNSQENNTTHAKTFETDKENVKATQRKIFDELLGKVRADFNTCKTKISTDVNNTIAKGKEDTKNMDEHQQSQIKNEVELFKGEVGNIDTNQKAKIDEQIAFFHSECQTLEDSLHAMLEDHKAKYQNNATTLQDSLTKTVQENIQNVKDAIADFTLQFMNAIDEAFEKAENNESKLTEIFNYSNKIVSPPPLTTWHVCGIDALEAAILDYLNRVKSSIIVITPEVNPKILQKIVDSAINRQTAKYFYTTKWDLQQFGGIIEKMKGSVGNISFRNLKMEGDYFAVTRDAEEVIIAPKTSKPQDLVAIVSNQTEYCTLLSQFIGPVFQANSRPL